MNSETEVGLVEFVRGLQQEGRMVCVIDSEQEMDIPAWKEAVNLDDLLVSHVDGNDVIGVANGVLNSNAVDALIIVRKTEGKV